MGCIRAFLFLRAAREVWKNMPRAAAPSPSASTGLAAPRHSDTHGLTFGSLGRPLYSSGWSPCFSTYMTCVPPTPCGLYSDACW
jgi:hypothetical protein